jgi:hypothetical protein
MSHVQPLDLKLAPEVKDAMSTFLAQITDIEPTLVLLKDSMDMRWGFGAYGPQELAELERLGAPYLYSADGFVFAIPQPVDLSELQGMAFHLNEHGLVLRRAG